MKIIDQGIHTLDAYRLLSAALDRQGYACVVGLKSDAKPVQHFFQPDDIQGAVDDALRLSDAGFDSYFCTATLMDSASRKAAHVQCVRCFKLDLDVGTENPAKYTGKRAAIEALAEFCETTGLPIPTTVDSGNGVHVYWPLTEALDADTGKRYSENLKAICITYGLKADPTCTADLARILRVPGTMNFKDPANPKPVRLKHLNTPVDTDMILALLDRLHASSSTPLTAPVQTSGLMLGALPAHLQHAEIDDTTRGLLAGRPKSFAHLLQRSLAGAGCAQIAYAYQQQTEIDEPHWRACLSAAYYSADGAKAIHDISSRHPGYSPSETIKKASRIKAPYTCAKFESNWPSHCRGCPHKGKITTPIQLGEDDSASSSTQLAVLPHSVIDPWPQPDPLPNQLRNVQPLDLNLLPDALRPWVADIVDRMQCPPDFVAVTALSALGTVIGRRIGIRPKRQDDWTEYCNLWACVVGRPGVMKSPAMTAALAPLNALAAKASRRYEDERATYEAEEQVRALRIDAQKKSAAKTLAKDPNAQIQIQAPDGGEAPVLRRYLVNDTSAEALLDICIENPQGVCAYRDELVSLLKSLDREGQEGSRGFYLTGWNGNSSYTADRIGRGRNMRAEAVCLSLLGSTQPGRIAEYLRAAISGGVSDDGLIQRFSLLVWPDIHQTWQNVDRWPDTHARTLVFDLFEKLDAADPVVDWGATIVTGYDGQPAEGEPPFVRLNDQAAATFLKWRSVFEAEINSGNLHPAMESHLSKYRKLVPSLALILHLADGGRGDVADPAMKRALEWAHYLRSHAERAYGAATGLAGVASAEAVIKHLRRGDLARQFVARDVYRPQWAMLTSTEEANRAIAILLEYGWLRSEIRSTGGRPQTVFIANPFIFGERDSGSIHREAAA